MPRLKWERAKRATRYIEDEIDRVQWRTVRVKADARSTYFPGAQAARCSECGCNFWRKPEEEWKILCLPCFKTMKLAQGQIPKEMKLRVALTPEQVSQKLAKMRRQHGR